ARAAAGDGLLVIDDAHEEASRARLWAARKALSPALRTLAPGKINEDAVVPVSRIPAPVDGVRAIARESLPPIVPFGPAGSGRRPRSTRRWWRRSRASPRWWTASAPSRARPCCRS